MGEIPRDNLSPTDSPSQAVSSNAWPLWGKEESRRLAGRLPMLWGVENGHFSGAQNPVNLFIFSIEVLVF